MASRKLGRSKNLKLQNNLVEKLPSHCQLSTNKRTVVMCDEWNESPEPPDKRRKTDRAEVDVELWGDDEDEDDVIFSQMVIDDIEEDKDTSQNVATLTLRKEPNNNSNHGLDNKKEFKMQSSGQNEKKSARFNYPKSLSTADAVSQQVKSQGYGTMTHASTSTVTGSLHPLTTAFPKNSTSQVKGFHPQSKAVKGRISAAAGSLQAGCKPDTSCVNSSLTKLQLQAAAQKPDFADIMQKKIQKLEEENAFFRQDNQKLKESQYGRDGQIKMLRTKVTQLEAEKSRDKQEKMKQKEQQTKSREEVENKSIQTKIQSEKEKKLETDLEKLKNEFQFKERDVAELQERCRRMEKQSRGDTSPCRSQFQSPGKTVVREARSPRHSRLLTTSPRTPQRAVDLGAGGFPTRMTFMADEKRYSSPAKPERDKGIQVADGSLQQLRVVKQRKMKLNSKGGMTGPHIASKLLGGTTNPPSDPVCNIRQSVISLLQSRPAVSLDPGVHLERDVATRSFSTTAGSRSKGYLSNDSGSSRDSLQNPVILPENIALAQQGICSLLDSSSNNSSNTETMTKTIGSEMSNLQTHAGCILVLPLVENYLQNYYEVMQGINDSSYISQSTGLSTDTQSVTDSLTSSVKGAVLENAAYMNSVENQTLCALLTLEKLVTYSPHIRLVLVCEREFAQLIQEGEPGAGRKRHPVLTAGLGVISQTEVKGVTHIEGGERQPACEENDFHINLSDVLLELDNTCVKVLKNCDILCKVMKLANPVEFNNKLGNLHLCEAALRILTVLAKASTSSQLERFENLFTQECMSGSVKLYSELSVSHQVSLSSTCLDLLTQLSRSAFLLSHLCSQEDCLLLSVYNLCLYLLDQADISHLRPLYNRVFDLMTSILMHHNGGSKLLESNCSCNYEVVRVVSVCLHKELLCYRTSPHHLGLASLRRGFSVLHALSLRDKQFTRHHAQECRHQYVELVWGFENILKHIPGVEDSELNQVYELWDFEQDYPDSPEDEELMEDDCLPTPAPFQQLAAATATASASGSERPTGHTGRGGLLPQSQAIDVVMLEGV